MGRVRLGAVGCGLFCVVAIAYLALPFSIRLEPETIPKRLQTIESQSQDSTRAACSPPWRQLVAPPTVHATVDFKKSSAPVTLHNRQPLCRDSGRSRAIVAGWLLLAAAGFFVLARGRRAEAPPAHATAPDLT